jgi:hypothetical protein
MPEYGSVIVAHAFPDSQPVGTVSLAVLGLDHHKLRLHPQDPGQSEVYDFLGCPTSFADVFSGMILEDMLGKVKSSFDEALAASRTRHGEKRSAGSNKQGHQFTPAMVHALLTQAVKQSGGSVPPKGGFTDCGIHTGGQPRNTSFPLVRSYYHWLLKRVDDSEDTTFQKAMLHFDMRIVEEGIVAVGSRMPGCDGWDRKSHGELRMELDCAMTFIVEACAKYSKLHALKVNVECALELASRLDSKMKALLERIQADEAASFTFGDIESEIAAPGAFRNPRIFVDACSPWKAPSSCMDDVDALTRDNIGLINVFETTSGFDWPSLLCWTTNQLSQSLSSSASAWLLVQ